MEANYYWANEISYTIAMHITFALEFLNAQFCGLLGMEFYV